jgi:UDP-glucose 4-epimerase
MQIQGARILVTGAAGHLGSHIVEALVREGPAEVVAVDRSFAHDPVAQSGALRHPVVKQVECDIASTDRMRALVAGTDVVVHTAAVLSRDAAADLRMAYDVNMAGTFGLIEASVSAKVRKFIFTSSSSVYDGHDHDQPVKESEAFDPVSMYGAGKATAEMLLRVFHTAHGLDYVALRCATIYGVRQSLRSNTARLIPESFDRIERGLAPVIHGDGSQAYDFIDVVDVARAHLAAINSSATGQAYNIATGISTRVGDVVQGIADITGTHLAPVHVPQETRYLIPSQSFDVSKAARELGFRASTPLRSGLENYFHWRRSGAVDALIPV